MGWLDGFAGGLAKGFDDTYYKMREEHRRQEIDNRRKAAEDALKNAQAKPDVVESESAQDWAARYGVLNQAAGADLSTPEKMREFYLGKEGEGNARAPIKAGMPTAPLGNAQVDFASLPQVQLGATGNPTVTSAPPKAAMPPAMPQAAQAPEAPTPAAPPAVNEPHFYTDPMGQVRVGTKTRDRSESQVYRDAARELMSKGLFEEADKYRRTADDYLKADIEQDFLKQKVVGNDALRRVAMGDIDGALDTVVSGLNLARDGVTYKLNRTDKGYELQTMHSETGLSPGKPIMIVDFAKPDPKLQLQQFIETVTDPAKYAEIYKFNLDVADKAFDRLMKTRQDNREDKKVGLDARRVAIDEQLNPFRAALLGAQTAGVYNEMGARDATTYYETGIPSGSAPRGVRNNNPGNLEYGDFARSLGAVGSDGRFAIFPSAEAGIKAQEALLSGKSYVGGGANTIAKIIQRYAPGSDGNDVAAYVQAVAKQTGIDPTRKLTAADIPAVAAAMRAHENGGYGYTGARPALSPKDTAASNQKETERYFDLIKAFAQSTGDPAAAQKAAFESMPPAWQKSYLASNGVPIAPPPPKAGGSGAPKAAATETKPRANSPASREVAGFAGDRLVEVDAEISRINNMKGSQRAGSASRLAALQAERKKLLAQAAKGAKPLSQAELASAWQRAPRVSALPTAPSPKPKPTPGALLMNPSR